PYVIELSSGYNMNIKFLHGYRGPPPIESKELLDFIRQFANNLKDEYPPPGFAPHYAIQKHFDPTLYTKWTLEFRQGIQRLPISVLLDALAELVTEYRRYGPATVLALIQQESFRPDKFSFLELAIRILAGDSLDISPPSGLDDFQTS
ncbi:MAG: hypothetical protein Q9163_006174, partial [Psora crenata]